MHINIMNHILDHKTKLIFYKILKMSLTPNKCKEYINNSKITGMSTKYLRKKLLNNSWVKGEIIKNVKNNTCLMKMKKQNIKHFIRDEMVHLK